MNISTLFYAGIFLCASLCCPPDDEGFTYFDANLPDLANVQENEALFAVGDTLWIEITVPKVVSVNGETTDISALAGNSELAYTIFNVFKISEFENPQPINFSESEVIVQKGSISISNQSIQSIAMLANDSFKSVFGLVLKETGSYYITGEDFREGELFIAVDTSSSVIVSLTSNIVNATAENKYFFEVK